MAEISLQWQQQITASGGGRRVLPPPLPQKIIEKIGRHFSVETKAYIRRRR
jgi:carbamate kinase